METYSPFPAKKGTAFELRFRRALWMSVRPWYGAKNTTFSVLDVYRVFMLRFWFPFACVRIVVFGRWGVHAYIGWKPIPVHADPAFCWRGLNEAQKAIEKGELFVQASMRWGGGNADTLE